MRCLLCLLVGAFSVSLLAEVNATMLGVRVQVPRAGHLSLASPGAAVDVQQLSGGAEGKLLRVRVRRQGADGRVPVLLLARSNTAYRVVAGVLTVAGPTGLGVQISAASVAPNAGGARVMPQAAAVRSTPASISGPLDNAIVLEGSRISRGGNNSTADNALLVHMQVELPEGASEAEILFKMELE